MIEGTVHPFARRPKSGPREPSERVPEVPLGPLVPSNAQARLAAHEEVSALITLGAADAHIVSVRDGKAIVHAFGFPTEIADVAAIHVSVVFGFSNEAT